jgi:AraC-like DNA-binding protein
MRITKNTGMIPTLDRDMDVQAKLRINFPAPISPLNAGLFVSNGTGTHDRRTIDSFVLIFVRKGTLDLYEEAEQFHLQEGQALILWPNCEHGGLSPFPRDLRFYWVHFRLASQGDADTSDCLDVPRLVTVRNPDRLIEFFHRYLDDQETGRLTSTGASLLLLLMLDEIRSTPASTAAPSEDSLCPIVALIEGFIANHYNEDISTSCIAGELNYNPDYLERVFRQRRGYTITRAIHRRRVKDARTLLIQHYMNIEEIAHSCGYRDAGYFRRVFKTMTGMTPHRFRHLHTHLHMNSH